MKPPERAAMVPSVTNSATRITLQSSTDLDYLGGGDERRLWQPSRGEEVQDCCPTLEVRMKLMTSKASIEKAKPQEKRGPCFLYCLSILLALI